MVASEPYVPCTVDDPCGPDWAAAGTLAAVVLTVVALFASPALGLGATVVSAILLMLWSLVEPPPASRGALTACLVGLVGLAAVLSAAEDARRKRLVEDAAVPATVGLWPGSPSLPRMRGTLLGLVAAAAFVASLGMATYRAHQEREWEERTPHVTGRVQGYDVDEYFARVELPDRDADIEVLDVEDYPIGSRVVVWDDGSKARMVSEPYDPFGWILGTIAAASVALVVGLRVMRLRREVRTLLSEPQHMTRVGVLPWPRHDAVIFDVSDVEGMRPLLRLPVSVTDDRGPGRFSGWVDEVDIDDLEDSETEDWPPVRKPEPATAFGVLRPGRIAALRLDDGAELKAVGRLRSATW
jgi:hypothetical protein